VRSKALWVFVAMVALLGGSVAADAGTGKPLRFAVTFPASLRQAAADGRVYVVISRDGSSDPRDQIDIVGGVPFWGRNVDHLAPGRPALVDGADATYGYPLPRLDQLPAGRYSVQAFLNVYSTFRRSDGSVVKMHLPCGDGQDIFHSPDNLYSTPRWIDLDPRRSGTVRLNLDHLITPKDPVPAGGTCQQGNPTDTAHVRHVKILSPSLTAFWGRPMYVGANVLLPAGYDDPANASLRYPVEYHFAHFTENAPHGFREDGGNAFSQFWLSAAAPKMISVEVREENPFYDSSYVVDSPNTGPYGTATTKELIPALDGRFRTIAAPWARLTSGGSTGGWEALASLVFYPDVYGGTFAGYPDPVDFHRHQIVDVYDDANAYDLIRDWDRTARPDSRDVHGEVDYTMAQENLWELALGDHDRSGGAWAIWESVYGPQGPDGYPALVWDKRTGQIDHAVAARWKPKDLTAKLGAEWATLGPKLRGEIYVYVGDMDTYFLNDAVELLQAQLGAQTNPPADATFLYGREKPHGWTPYTDAQWFGVYADYLALHAPAGTATAAWAPRSPVPAADPDGGVVAPDPATVKAP
jgi:Putative esterase